MSVAHTPGPWECQPTDSDGPDYGVSIIGLRLNDDGSPIYTPTNGLVGAALPWPTEIDSGDFSRVEANACLIAAAPDLLEALHLLLNDYITVAQEAGCELIGSDADPEVARARVAIAKARGQ